MLSYQAYYSILYHTNHKFCFCWIEKRLYPSSSFWGTYNGKQKLIREAASKVASTKADRTSLVLHVYDNTIIECGDIDGAVIGCWANVDSTIAPSEVCEDDAHSGYWACAAVWSDSWDSRTMDRVSAILLVSTYFVASCQNSL